MVLTGYLFLLHRLLADPRCGAVLAANLHRKTRRLNNNTTLLPRKKRLFRKRRTDVFTNGKIQEESVLRRSEGRLLACNLYFVVCDWYLVYELFSPKLLTILQERGLLSDQRLF